MLNQYDPSSLTSLDPYEGGFNYWVGSLNNEEQTRADVLLNFAIANENDALFTATTGLSWFINYLLLLALTTALLLPAQSQSETNHFGAGGVFELDLRDSEIPWTPKQEIEQKFLEKQLKKGLFPNTLSY